MWWRQRLHSPWDGLLSRNLRSRLELVTMGVALVLVTALSACGSTVQVDGHQARAGDLGLDVAGGGERSDAPLGTGNGSTGNGSIGGGSAGDPTGTPLGGASASRGVDTHSRPTGVEGETGTSAAPAPGSTGRGFTEDEIFIGHMTWNDGDRALGRFGIEGVSPGDQEAQARAAIKIINDRGGVAGRKLVPVFYDIQTGATDSTNGQAACARWTEDQPVFAAITTIGWKGEVLSSCLAKHKTPFIANAPDLDSRSRIYNFPLKYAPSQVVMERMIPAWAERATALGYFREWNTEVGGPGVAEVKIGAVSESGFQANDFFRVLSQSLAQQHRSLAETFAPSGPADYSAAVLRFRSAGVTHVFVNHGLDFLFFTQAAESQQYRPRYSISSAAYPRFVQGNAPAAQMAGAIGVGWLPTTDVAQDLGDFSGAHAKCLKAMRDSGQDTSKGATSFMLLACDGYNFVASALERGDLSPQGFERGARAIGSMTSAATFGIALPDGRRDGAFAVRDLAYGDDCKCFRYVSTTNHNM